MKGREIREAFKKGDYVFGTCMVSQSTYWPGVLASLGMDLVFIDTEHVPLGREQVSTMCKLYSKHGIAPVVRIPSPDPYQVSMVLDGGASGIIAPYVETVEQVKSLVGAVKYKPLKGERLNGFIYNNVAIEPELEAYADNQNQDNVLIVNIESVPAINNLDEILKVKGLDAVLVGPHDLSCSLGIPEDYHHPKFKEAIQTIIQKGRAHNVGVGIHVWDQIGYDVEMEWAKLGANFIMHSNDLNIFTKALEKEMNNLKAYLGIENSSESKEVTI
ncbi:HpcH/HpaI aldolase family protein [Membranihabitans marinus]|uniref:HpcH/HpaI aldolase family protein n=1 Tax=Membranihabitans marinus TaxID=1227546 RepID=UPI001F0308FE|nr:aldolase/citrate lyase family protein [Membranihabitans marinus]